MQEDVDIAEKEESNEKNWVSTNSSTKERHKDQLS